MMVSLAIPWTIHQKHPAQVPTSVLPYLLLCLQGLNILPILPLYTKCNHLGILKFKVPNKATTAKLDAFYNTKQTATQTHHLQDTY